MDTPYLQPFEADIAKATEAQRRVTRLGERLMTNFFNADDDNQRILVMVNFATAATEEAPKLQNAYTRLKDDLLSVAPRLDYDERQTLIDELKKERAQFRAIVTRLSDIKSEVTDIVRPTFNRGKSKFLPALQKLIDAHSAIDTMYTEIIVTLLIPPPMFDLEALQAIPMPAAD